MTFTEAEETEMQEYQEALRTKYGPIDKARRQHADDGRTIKHWHWGNRNPSQHGQEVCARILRRMQVRKEVFKRLQIPLNGWNF